MSPFFGFGFGFGLFNALCFAISISRAFLAVVQDATLSKSTHSVMLKIEYLKVLIF